MDPLRPTAHTSFAAAAHRAVAPSVLSEVTPLGVASPRRTNDWMLPATHSLPESHREHIARRPVIHRASRLKTAKSVNQSVESATSVHPDASWRYTEVLPDDGYTVATKSSPVGA